MKQSAASLVRRLWQYCSILRDDGLSYPDYVEQLTYLLFLKMADERKHSPVPQEYSWASFAGMSAKELHRHYAVVLEALGRRDGTLGLIFHNARNKIKDPAKLRLLVENLIGQTDWGALSPDVKGDAYEGLLEKNAQDTKSGAGQYFTPRVLIDAIVQCVQPKLGEVVCDPACGTGGFLLSSHEYLRKVHPKLSAAQERHLSTRAFRGVELVEEVARLATMNLFLHGIGDRVSDADLPIVCDDSLKRPITAKVDIVLTNPPFGTRGSVTFTHGDKNSDSDELVVMRPEFWVKTANKQLNFLQHVVSMLAPNGRAAIVLPDNVLFESGAAEVIRRHLFATHDVHTLLRLPTGLFYAQGVKANVLFFDKVPVSDRKRAKQVLWVYNLRDTRISLKNNPLRREDLQDFVAAFSPGNRVARKEQSTRGCAAKWRCFDTADIVAGEGCRLDLEWGEMKRGRSTQVRVELEEMAALIAMDLTTALKHISSMSSSGTAGSTVRNKGSVTRGR
ncbi:MAG TPA: class I SAM-dependent DNA methyltransferase [Phycisphaerales bacterium]|nr:class I SAM-dependent DNA methyltransferase [Phycisphaerales bacterium]